MPKVVMTPHLYRFFPILDQADLQVPTGSVAKALQHIDVLAPGFLNYVQDEHGALRCHVNISIDNQLVFDRKTLSDKVPEGATLYIIQALTGG